MSILITGGLGYIGSHTAIELLDADKDIVIVDNLSNSDLSVLDKIKKITNKNFAFYELDIRDEVKLNEVFKKENIDSVLHFASYKAVGESMENPLMYYDNNIISTISLLKVMKKYNVNKIVFSSSATVYGIPKELPITEEHPCSPVNPYGRTKLIIENILKDVVNSDKNFNAAILRYFNPVGAHKSGLIGENPKGTPNNLMPFLIKVANKEIDKLKIFGNSYDTKDGTGVRDYIHIVDLAKGHLKALDALYTSTGLLTYNLGTGVGYSVLDVVDTFSRVNNIDIPYEFTDNRAGDVSTYYSSVSKAKKELNWEVQHTLEDMCIDSWKSKK